MADIRINALATTAASTASDDFVAVDGSANGTRKLNAYSPTFGGNLTVSGNAAIGTDVFKIDSTNTRILFGLAAALQGDTVEIAAKSNAGAISLFGRASNNQSVISFRQNGSPTQKAFVQGGDTGLELGAGSSIGLTINSSNNTTLTGNLTVSGTGTSSFSGILSEKTASMTNPVLIGEMADSTTVGVVSFSNSRTSSAMLGIAGTTTDLFLAVPSTGTFQFRNGWTEQMRLFANGNLFVGASPVDGGQKLQVSGTGYFSGNVGIGATSGTGRLTVYGGQTEWGATSSLGFLGYTGGNPIVGSLGALSLLIYTNGTEAARFDSNQHFKLTPAVASSIITTQSAPQIRMGSRFTGRSNVILDSTAGRVWNFENTGTSLTIGYSGLDALTIAETTGDATFAGDLTLGTSGPSVKSSLSARAPRQGLVFDGTAGASATLASAIGTSSVTIDVVATVPSAAPAAAYGVFSIGVNGSANALSAYFNNDGTLLLILVGATGSDYRYVKTSRNIISALGGKTARITFVRDSENSTKYIYINGVAEALQADVTAGTPPAWSGSVTSTTYYIGKLTSTLYPYLGSFGPINTYNRALSASEVVALYEAGAPAGADYKQAYGTAKVTANGAPQDGTTFSSGTFTVPNSGIISFSTIYPAFPGIGVRLRVKFDYTTTTSGNLRLGGFGYNPSINGNGDNLAFSGSGTYTYEAVANATGAGWSANGFEFRSTGWTGTITNITITPLGLLLAPDAAQAGGGLVWYDTSGNAANITLPASGVSWNVPTSGKVATGWAFGGDVGIGTTTPGKRLEVNKNLATNTVGAGEVVRLISDDGNNVGRITEIGFGVGPTGGTYSPVTLGTVVTTATGFNKKDFYIATRDATTDSAPSERLRLTASGNFLIGTTVDSSALLQVGTNTTTAAGGMKFGTDTALYRVFNGELVLSHVGGTNPYLYLNENGTNTAQFSTNGGNAELGTTVAGKSLTLKTAANTTALTLDSSQNATFAGNVTVNGTGTQSFKGTIALKAAAVGDGITLRESYAGNSLLFSVLQNSGDGTGATIAGADGAGSTTFSVNTQTGAATFSGSIAIGNTVNTVSPTSPNRTITMVIGGTTYYIHAKTTND